MSNSENRETEHREETEELTYTVYPRERETYTTNTALGDIDCVTETPYQ